MDGAAALARAQRYGDVAAPTPRRWRGSATALVRADLRRRCRRRSPSLDDDGAAMLRRRIDAVHAATGRCSPSRADAGRAGWARCDRLAATGPTCTGCSLGRIVRLLLDAGPPRRRRRSGCSGRCRSGCRRREKAAWVDGFFADGALLLIHDAELLGLLDAWVAGLAEQEFVDVLPLVRRTFGAFSRRRAAHDRRPGLRRPDAAPAARGRSTTSTSDRGRWSALGTVALILGGARDDRADDRAAARRWRLLLGEARRGGSSDGAPEPPTSGEMDEALAALYEPATRPTGQRARPAAKPAGSAASAPRVARVARRHPDLLPDQRRAGHAARRDRAART